MPTDFPAPLPTRPARRGLGSRLMAEAVAWTRATLHLSDTRRLLDLRDRYAGRRCFVVGTAPSLSHLDLTRLRDEPFFAVNRAYKAFDMGLPPIPFLVVGDPAGYEDFGDEIRPVPAGLRFYRDSVFRTACYRRAATPEPAIRIPSFRGGILKKGFQKHLWKGVGNDSSVLLMCVQIAYWLGFSEVYVIGCDLHYAAGNQYFFAAGTTAGGGTEPPGWSDDRRNRTILGANPEFAVARAAFEAAGRTLMNAGVGGNLVTLERVDYDRLFPTGPCWTGPFPTAR